MGCPRRSIVVNSVVMKRSKTCWTSAGSDAVTPRSLLRLGGDEKAGELRGKQLGRAQVRPVPLAPKDPLFGPWECLGVRLHGLHGPDRAVAAHEEQGRRADLGQAPVLHAVGQLRAQLARDGVDDLAACLP